MKTKDPPAPNSDPSFPLPALQLFPPDWCFRFTSFLLDHFLILLDIDYLSALIPPLFDVPDRRIRSLELCGRNVPIGVFLQAQENRNENAFWAANRVNKSSQKQLSELRLSHLVSVILQVCVESFV